ncbi:MAG: RES family NAD+ phosphorylase [Chloroflexi bacterium]|nr:RES family NAD+ phosphorylase [Chloroflexota bacterium]
MTLEVQLAHAREMALLYRIGRKPCPLEWPDFSRVGDGRFDDPELKFRTLYAAEQQLAAFLERLARFQVPIEVLQRLAQQSNATEPLPPTHGTVTKNWLESHSIGIFRITDSRPWLDLRSVETREALRAEMAILLLRYGFENLDIGVVCGSNRLSHRPITQAIARWAYEHGLAGIVFGSRIDYPMDCWAVFEGTDYQVIEVGRSITLDDPDLVAAARLLNLEIA